MTHRVSTLLLAGCLLHSLQLHSLELLQFVQLGLQKNATVGALFECSEYTGNELVRYLLKQQSEQDACHIVELGAGQGGTTKAIVTHLRPQDSLVLIELLPEFCDVLRKKYPPSEYPNITIIEGNVLDHYAQRPYDLCICTLPFNGFSSELTRAITEKIVSFVRPGGHFSYVAYAFLPTVRYYLFKWGNSRTDFFKQLAIMRDLDNKFQVERVLEWRNIPPIFIHHLQIHSNRL